MDSRGAKDCHYGPEGCAKIFNMDELLSHKDTVIQYLRTHLAEAEELLTRFMTWSDILYLCEPLPNMDFPENLSKIYEQAQTFLSHAPSDMVAVSAEDAREILAFIRNSKRLMKGEITQFQYEAYNRLKATL